MKRVLRVRGCSTEAGLETPFASWSVPTISRWSLGRPSNDTLSTDDDDDVVAAAACTVLVDDLNFWSKFTDDTGVTELGMTASSRI